MDALTSATPASTAGDVLTVRGRWSSDRAGVTLADVCAEPKKPKHTDDEIHRVFCRAQVAHAGVDSAARPT